MSILFLIRDFYPLYSLRDPLNLGKFKNISFVRRIIRLLFSGGIGICVLFIKEGVGYRNA